MRGGSEDEEEVGVDGRGVDAAEAGEKVAVVAEKVVLDDKVVEGREEEEEVESEQLRAY